jgi:hypothetical protein
MVDKLVPVEVVDGGKSTFSPFLYQPIYQDGANATSNGTVVSVGQSFTGGLIFVSGSPITTSGTLALTVVGTSGGIPYFSAANAWASSAALASNALVVGGGAGASPATVSTGTGVLAALANNTGSAGSFVINGGALGTPTSGTVTNLTGTASININGTVGATTANTGAFTTLSASSTVSGTGFSTYLASPPAIGGTAAAAGSFTTLTASTSISQSGVAVPTISSTSTLTNKRVQPRISSTTSITSPLAWNSDNFDQYAATAQAAALTINADSGTPTDGQKMIFRFEDNGTARALTWTTGSSKSFRAVGVTLPTTTVASKTVYVGCVYNSADLRWDAVAVSQEV